MDVIYAGTWNELTVKMIGYHHDHCGIYYAGKTKDVPAKFHPLQTNDKVEEYCFIYEEDKPNRASSSVG